MSKRGIITQARQEVSPESRKFVSKSMDIVNHIHDILEEKGWTQKELAAKLGKRESEISNMLTRPHNFTIKTLTAIEVALNEELFESTKKRGLTTILHLTSTKLNEQPNNAENFQSFEVEASSTNEEWLNELPNAS